MEEWTKQYPYSFNNTALIDENIYLENKFTLVEQYPDSYDGRKKKIVDNKQA